MTFNILHHTLPSYPPVLPRLILQSLPTILFFLMCTFTFNTLKPIKSIDSFLDVCAYIYVCINNIILICINIHVCVCMYHIILFKV